MWEMSELEECYISPWWTEIFKNVCQGKGLYGSVNFFQQKTNQFIHCQNPHTILIIPVVTLSALNQFRCYHKWVCIRASCHCLPMSVYDVTWPVLHNIIVPHGKLSKSLFPFKTSRSFFLLKFFPFDIVYIWLNSALICSYWSLAMLVLGSWHQVGLYTSLGCSKSIGSIHTCSAVI